jgi:hypothetical protein
MANEDDVLREQLASAPAAIRKLLEQGSWSAVVDEVAQACNFPADKKMALQNEVLFVLLAMGLRRDFEERVREELGIAAWLAHAIALEVDKRVFEEVGVYLPTEEE